MSGAGFLGQHSLLWGPCHLSPGPFLPALNFGIVAQWVLVRNSPSYLVGNWSSRDYVGKLQPWGQNLEETGAVPVTDTGRSYWLWTRHLGSFANWTCWFARAAPAKRYWFGSLNKRHLLSHSSGSEKSKSKVSLGLLSSGIWERTYSSSSQPPHPFWWPVALLLHTLLHLHMASPLCVQIYLFFPEDTSSIGLGIYPALVWINLN